MSMNLYLTDGVAELQGFTSAITKGRYQLPGLDVCRNKGRYYVILHPGDPVPPILKSVVDEISLYDEIPVALIRRELGLYTHESAEAEVEPTYSGERHIIRIRGKKMEDVVELFRLIKAGAIRPSVSYQGPQSGKSRPELEKELKQARQELEELREKLGLSEMTLREIRERARLACEKNAQFRTLAEKMRNEFWPICTKSRIFDETSRILNA